MDFIILQFGMQVSNPGRQGSRKQFFVQGYFCSIRTEELRHRVGAHRWASGNSYI